MSPIHFRFEGIGKFFKPRRGSREPVEAVRDVSLCLSDRILVMSHRPGTIIHGIRVELPHRDDPFQRSLHPDVATYTAEI